MIYFYGQLYFKGLTELLHTTLSLLIDFDETSFMCVLSSTSICVRSILLKDVNKPLHTAFEPCGKFWWNLIYGNSIMDEFYSI